MFSAETAANPNATKEMRSHQRNRGERRRKMMKRQSSQAFGSETKGSDRKRSAAKRKAVIASVRQRNKRQGKPHKQNRGHAAKGQREERRYCNTLLTYSASPAIVLTAPDKAAQSFPSPCTRQLLPSVAPPP